MKLAIVLSSKRNWQYQAFVIYCIVSLISAIESAVDSYNSSLEKRGERVNIMSDWDAWMQLFGNCASKCCGMRSYKKRKVRRLSVQMRSKRNVLTPLKPLEDINDNEGEERETQSEEAAVFRKQESDTLFPIEKEDTENRIDEHDSLDVQRNTTADGNKNVNTSRLMKFPKIATVASLTCLTFFYNLDHVWKL